MEAQDGEVGAVAAWLQEALGQGALEDEVWVETVGLVALHDFGRRVVEVLVRVVVFVPLEAGVHKVEEAWLAWLPSGISTLNCTLSCLHAFGAPVGSPVAWSCWCDNCRS